MADQPLTLGRIVHYTLSEGDVNLINSLRTQSKIGGNVVKEGDVFPAIAVRVWSEANGNLRVLLDGHDTYWATSRAQGEGPSHWDWPART